ncbi:MAG: formylglycine-generating enzyme family protein [Candidatus Latescibacteria bacterium]|nr:formylglycine-generating enzyme family protein [Candidatus Latescibacterota bacterium]
MRTNRERMAPQRAFLFHIVLAVLAILPGCSQLAVVNEEKNDGYFTGKPGFEWAEIPGRDYEMTVFRPRNTDESGIVGQSIERKIKLDPFKISVSEITNRQYCMFLNDALKKGDNIHVDYNGEDMVVNGSVKEIQSGFHFMVLKPVIPSFRAELNGSGIYYTGGKFKVVKGQEDCPVVNVTGIGAEAFAEYYGLVLPTEAQWEYAAAAGRARAFGTADGNIGGHNANYDNTIGHSVRIKSYRPNEFGLYDMCGNAAEWCMSQLRYHGVTESSVSTPGYIAKGGSWLSFEDACRIRSREMHDRLFKYPHPRGRKISYHFESTAGIFPRSTNGDERQLYFPSNDN